MALTTDMKIGIGIGAGGLAIVILVIVLFVALRKRSKGTVAEKTLDDRELIAENSKAVEALFVLAEDNASLVEELKALQEKLKYLMPSDDSKVTEYDKKIKNLIGDMRIALTKSDGEDSKKTDAILTDLKLAVADRSAKM